MEPTKQLLGLRVIPELSKYNGKKIRYNYSKYDLNITI